MHESHEAKMTIDVMAARINAEAAELGRVADGLQHRLGRGVQYVGLGLDDDERTAARAAAARNIELASQMTREVEAIRTAALKLQQLAGDLVLRREV